jgi:hypothetical protein
MDRSSPLFTRRHALLVGAVMTSVHGSPHAQEGPAGTIDTLHGNAFAEGAIPRRALHPAAEVFVNDLVETEINSGLTMHLGKATFVKLGALAKFRIDKFVVDAGGIFELEQGPMLMDRDDSQKKSNTADTLAVRSDCRAWDYVLCRPEQLACSLAVVSCQLPLATVRSSSDLALAPT